MLQSLEVEWSPAGRRRPVPLRFECPIQHKILLSVLAFETFDKNQIWLYDLSSQSVARPLTFEGHNYAPVWMPDGRSLIFQSDREAATTLYRQVADGSNPPERLLQPKRGATYIAFSVHPSSRFLAFAGSNAGLIRAIDFLALSQDQTIEPLPRVILKRDVFSRWRVAVIQNGRWSAHFPVVSGARQIVVGHVEFVQTSCGYAVPEMNLVGERDTLLRWADSKGEEGLKNYRRDKNTKSIDGIPAPATD
jgi:WD40 repeat protein